MPLPYDHPFYETSPTNVEGYYAYAVIGGANSIGGGSLDNAATDEEQFVNTDFVKVYKHNGEIEAFSTPTNQQTVTTYDRLDDAGRYNFTSRLSELLREDVRQKILLIQGGQVETALTDAVDGWASSATKTQISTMIGAAETKSAESINFAVIDLLQHDTTDSETDGATVLAALETWITDFRTARGNASLPIFVLGLGPTPATLELSTYPLWEEIREATSAIAMDGVYYIRTDDLDYSTYVHETLADEVTPDEVSWNAAGHNAIADRILRRGKIEGVFPGGTRLDIELNALGDSITAQNTGAADRFEAAGYITILQMMNGQRYSWGHDFNFGVSGDDSEEALARINDVTSASGDIVIVCLGANDRSAKWPAAQTITALGSIYEALRACGKKIVALPNLPRHDDHYDGLGFSSGEITQAKADEAAVNAWIAAQPGILYADCYDTLVENIDSVTYDGLHPNQLGAFYIAEAIDAVLYPLHGARSFRLHENNVLDNTDFSGTGGTVVATGEGVVADDHSTIGSAPSDETTERVFSKDPNGGQRINWDFPEGGSNADNVRIYQRQNTNYNGQSAYYECEIRISNNVVGDGTLRTLNAEIRTNASLAIGMDRLGADDNLPLVVLRNWCNANKRRLLLRTPVVTVPDYAYIEGRVSIEANTTGGALRGQITLLNEQLVVT